MNKSLSVFSVLLSLLSFVTLVNGNQLAIVIDDLGYSYKAGKRAIDLPARVTFAILPFAPNTRALAEYAKKKNKEVIIHLPMEAENEQQNRVEEITLREYMSSIQYSIILGASLNRLKNAIGVSNHTGSLLTIKKESMRKLMSKLAQRKLYFLDSKTSNKSIAIQIAEEFNVPNVSRDFFLDNIKEEANMEAAFNHAIKLSRKTGEALIISHPYTSSLSFLESKLKNPPEDIELVFASQLTPSYPITLDRL